MRYSSPGNVRQIAQAKVDAVRSLLFGPHAGLPGERWLARPLVARDMLNWYFPSKYGFQEFRLNEYFAMQAERYRKREEPAWTASLRETLSVVEEKKTEIRKFLDSVSEADMRANGTLMDLKSMLDMLEKDRGVFAVIGGEETRDSESVNETISRKVPKDKRHRFIDPLFRRRRLKWMERFMAGMNNSKEIKYNRHFTRHPDTQKHWPTNLGSVTVRWPNRRN